MPQQPTDSQKNFKNIITVLPSKKKFLSNLMQSQKWNSLTEFEVE